MRVLLLDQTGSFLDFALRLQKAGHYARLSTMDIQSTHDKRIRVPNMVGKGLVEKVPPAQWTKHVRWADLILTSDNANWLQSTDVFKKQGFPIFGPSFESSRLELERGKGQDLFAKIGIDVMPYETFSDCRTAEKYVLATMKRYVSKPTGDADKALSYVSQHPADMVFMLRRWHELNKLRVPFLLQEFVPGTEIAVGGWLGRRGFSKWVVENFEHKKLMNDDLGPNTGEMGTVIKYTTESKLADQVLFPLERDLIKLGHTGFIDVAVIVDEQGRPRPLEFTARPAWPLFNIQQVLHPDPVEWMLALLDGNDDFSPRTDVAVGVVLAIPDFPYSSLTKREVSGIPAYGIEDENPRRDLICPCEMMAGTAPAMEGEAVVDQKMMVSTGDYLAVCCGFGESVRDAMGEAYKTVDSVEVPNNLLYRTDIGKGMKGKLDDLQAHGFASAWQY